MPPEPSRLYQMYLGWGDTEFGGARSDVLMRTWMTVISKQECSNSFNRVDDPKITEVMICVEGKTSGSGVCQGDSGVYHSIIILISSIKLYATSDFAPPFQTYSIKDNTK